MDNEFAELFGFDISGDELENKDVNIETLVNQIFKKTYLEIIEENEDNSDNKVVCWKNKREIFELYLKHRGKIMIAIEKDKISIFIYGGKLLYYPNPKNCVQINAESILNNYEKMMQVVEDYIKVLENLEIVNIETKIK